ncbi:MAG TPA: Ig-like domain-containing protein [Rudaea sp.]
MFRRLAAPVFVASLLFASHAAVADTTVFINEIHYDNVGTDANEGVEIAGPAGTDLSNWQVIPYNGNGGAMYAPTAGLSGAIPATCGGYGVVSVPIAGLQNGAPDGIALVDNHGVVVQFLSYEGVFTASDGPAAGMQSVDIGVSESGSEAVGQSLQLTGSGTQYGDFTWHADSAASFGACNTGQTFGTPPDIAPAVTITAPANGASAVALNASITVTFSEAVTVSNTFADISCTNSGNHSYVVGGSGNTYTLDPDVDLAFGESCTVTVLADQVTDLDGTPDEMAADYAFSFTTVAGDVPPTVANTVPLAGATAFPRSANLQVTFSEPVTLTEPGAFTLACDTSGAHTFAVTGSGASYVLNPDSDFTALESCTWTIVASHVIDLDGAPDAMSTDVTIVFTVGADTSDYYAGVDTSSGPALAGWLHNRIKDHTAYPYTASTTDTWDILDAADEDPMNPNDVVDLYKNVSYAKGSGSLNREHTWPNSYGFNDVTTSNGHPYPPYTDCHMLYMADSSYNQSRSNKPYGQCSGSCTEKPTVLTNGFGGAGHSDFTSSAVWQVWDHRRGDAARAILYMGVRYKGGINAMGQAEPTLILTDNTALIQTTASGAIGQTAYMGLLSAVLDWNDQDPPDTGEQLRNEVVYSYQHNRNPFIDHPEWARCVYTNTNCPTAGNDFSVAATPNSVTVADGRSVIVTVSTAPLSGSAEVVTFSISGLPAGATAVFNPASVTAGQSSTLTITADALAPASVATVTVTAAAPSTTHTTTFSLNVLDVIFRDAFEGQDAN